MLRSLFLKTIRDLRGQILGWGLGTGLLGLFIIALYPAFSDQMEMYTEMFQAYPPAFSAFFGDLANLAEWSGWLSVEFFSWVAPILAIFAVAAGTGLIAGEEERRTLDLLLSQPIRRWRVVAEKAAALAVALVLVCLLAATCLVLSAVAIGQTDGLGRLVLTTMDIVPITLACGTLALMSSVVFRSRRLATSLSVAVAIGSWFVDSLGKVVDVLEPYRFLALFHYYNGGTILTGGGELARAGVLLGLSAMFVAVSLVAFQRRDVSV